LAHLCPEQGRRAVTTTVAKLTAAFAKCLAANVGSVYFGRVQYVDGDEWADYLSDGDNASSIIFGSAVGRAHTLFLKRKTFKHEQEFRIVYHDASRTQGDGRLYQLAIPASEVIDQILVDGRLPQNELEAVTLEVNAHLNDVPERSTIYDVPYGRLLVIDGYGSRVSSDSVDTST
jgi:hypothetical protein